MKILYYDCFSGISGDMNIGALLDLGVNKEHLINELSKLNLGDEYTLNVKRDIRKGIEGTKFEVILNEEDHVHHEHPHQGEEAYTYEGHDHVHTHDGHDHHHGDHNHEHSHDDMNHVHTHSHEELKEHNHVHKHEHRNLKNITDIINSSELSDHVKELSINIFTKVAIAESKIHGKPLDQVHFHEVGAIDSIVDIVAAAICIDYLKVDKIMSSTIELGGGLVRCAHGLFPVPAPATLEILKGIPIKSGVVPFETTTPTGAAVLATVVNEFSDNKNFIIEKIGYGIGGRDTEVPNVLRVILANKN